MRAEQIRNLLVKLPHLLLEKLQFLKRHLDQPPIDWVELGTSPQHIAQLGRGGSQALIRQGSQSGRVGFSVSERLQHTTGTNAQKVCDKARQLNMGFFQQALQLVLHPYMQTGHLEFAACYCSPQTLFGIRYEAQD